MVTAAISTAVINTRTGLARSSIAHHQSFSKRPTGASVSRKSARQFVSLEYGAAALGQGEPSLAHAGAALVANQSLADRVLPDRQMRAAAPPCFGVGVAARRLRHPGEELLRERGCSFVHVSL